MLLHFCSSPDLPVSGPPVSIRGGTMVFVRRALAVFLLFVCMTSLLFAGGTQEPASDRKVAGSPQSGMSILGESDASVRFREVSGRIVEIPKFPKRTVIMHNSILDLWYMAGGTSLARLRGAINVPAEAKDLPVLGSIASIDVEKIMKLEPDLLIFSGTSEYQRKISDFFASEGVASLGINYENYDDFGLIFDLFTRLNGRRDLYEAYLIPTQEKVQSIIDRVPKGVHPKVCILFASTNYVKVETEETVTGDYCKRLGAVNIYRESAFEGAGRVDLSLEYILEQDPDLIFVTTMGDVEKCTARIEMEVSSNPVWASLSAVKNGRFHYLDKSFSIYKPNRAYPEAFQRIAELLYPGTDFSLGSGEGKAE